MSEENLDSTRVVSIIYVIAFGLVTGWILYGALVLGHMILEWAGVTW